MRRRPVWLWVCVAYMLASVAFNVWLQVSVFQFLIAREKILVVVNLLSNFSGAVAYALRRKIGIYLLVLGFLDGALGEAWRILDAYRIGLPVAIPPNLIAFIFPLLVILYGVNLAKKGVLGGWPQVRPTKVDSTAKVFD